MFKFFSSAEARQSTLLTRTSSDTAQAEVDTQNLASALHATLENLAHSYNGRENINHLCQAIVDATPQVRFVWIGFCAASAEMVAPYAAVGACASETDDWQLPHSCFNFAGPYAQASHESIGEMNDLNSLFAPWRKDMDACSASSALAIPLRSDRPELRGLLVIYAADVDYFSHMGVTPFQALSHVAEIIWQQSNMMQVLTQKAQIDTLTGLMNRRMTMRVLERAIARAGELNEALSVMICRVDNFESMNEMHGWVVADALLAAFAKEITLRMRPQDKLGRWTSIEFLYVLPRTDIRQAEFFAQSLHDYIQQHTITAQDCAVHLPIRVSVAEYDKASNGLEDLIQQAHHNMLTAARATVSGP